MYMAVLGVLFLFFFFLGGGGGGGLEVCFHSAYSEGGSL